MFTISSFNGQLSLDRQKINQRSYYNLPNSAFWGRLSAILEQSAILLTCIKRQSVLKTFFCLLRQVLLYCRFSLTLTVFILAHPFCAIDYFLSILSQKNYGHGPIQRKVFPFAYNHIRDTVSIHCVFHIRISASIVPADILLGCMLFIISCS